MTTKQKIEKKGYTITFNFSWYNGEQKITSVTATKNNIKHTEKNITTLYKKLSY